MANGEMLRELRSLAQSEKVPTQAALRLMCSALAEVYEQIKIVAGAQDFYKAELAMLQEDLCDHKDENDDGHKAISQENNRQLTDLNETMHTMVTKIDELSIMVKAMRSNPMVVLGQFVKDHPKWSAFFGFLLFVMFNLWFVPEFRQAALIVLRVPPDIIKILTP